MGGGAAGRATPRFRLHQPAGAGGRLRRSGRRQHQHYLARRSLAGAGGRPPADRARPGYPRHTRGAGLRWPAQRAVHGPSEGRSNHRRAGLLRLFRRWRADARHALRHDRRRGPGHSVRALRRSLLQHGARLRRDPAARGFPRPTAPRLASAAAARRAALCVGAGPRQPDRPDPARAGHVLAALVPGGTVLRVPRAERLGRRRPHHRGRDAVRRAAALPPPGRKHHPPSARGAPGGAVRRTGAT